MGVTLPQTALNGSASVRSQPHIKSGPKHRETGHSPYISHYVYAWHDNVDTNVRVRQPKRLIPIGVRYPAHSMNAASNHKALLRIQLHNHLHPLFESIPERRYSVVRHALRRLLQPGGKKVFRLPGMEKASVSLAIKVILMRYVPATTNLENMTEAVGNAGFILELPHITLYWTSQGMHCAACSHRKKCVVSLLAFEVSNSVNLASLKARSCLRGRIRRCRRIGYN